MVGRTMPGGVYGDNAKRELRLFLFQQIGKRLPGVPVPDQSEVQNVILSIAAFKACCNDSF